MQESLANLTTPAFLSFRKNLVVIPILTVVSTIMLMAQFGI